MVTILRRSLADQGADSAARRTFSSELHTPKKMSQGPTLLSCGIMENDRWRDLDRKCPLQIDQSGASIWGCLPEQCQDGSLWHREAVTACAVTSLIKDLSISDHNGNPSAPPSKRQCRSLSFSDEMSSCRTSWRPLGSKVWTPVEKRRCYSGGSVQRYSSGVGPMQRSSSFSLPARANGLASPRHQAGPQHRAGAQPCQGTLGSAPCGQAGDSWSPDPHPVGGGRLDLQRSLSCSHEQFSFPEYCPPSASSTPASTPELARRSSGLARSRSQPCVLNDKKVGVKRRRPDEAREQRPSLDLAKMAQDLTSPCNASPGWTATLLGSAASLVWCNRHQELFFDSRAGGGSEWTTGKPPPHCRAHSPACSVCMRNCQTFSSLSCLSTGTDDRSPQSPFTLISSTRSWTALLSASSPGGRTPAGTPVPEPLPPSFDHFPCQDDLSCEESDGCTLDEDCCRRRRDTAWRDRSAATSSLCSLDGELDIEQIENN